MGKDLRSRRLDHGRRYVQNLRLASLRTILIAVTAGCGMLASAKDAAPRQQHVSIDEINGRIGAQQREIDSLTALRDQLHLDSARIALESTQRGSQISRKITEIDGLISAKKAMAAKIRAQYAKAQQDSAAIAARYGEQLVTLHKELSRLETTIISVSNDLQTLSQHRDQLGSSPATADDRGPARLQLQISRRDSLIRVRQADLAELTGRHDKLRQDSLQVETKRAGERVQFHAAIGRIDSIIALDDAAIIRAEQKRMSAKNEQEQKIALVKESVSLMSKQKRAFDARLVQTNGEIGTLTAERQRLQQSADASQQRYEQLHTPYQKALSTAEAELQSVNKEKSALSVLHQKLQLDSSISKIRDALDHAIQLEAEKKKGAKKLVEQRENELDSMLSKQDVVTRSTPGLRQLEARYQGSTVTQKTSLVNDALAGIENRIAAASALRDKASQNLALFERKNPAPLNPSAQRTEQIETQIAAKKKDVIQMTAMGDSLNIQMQDAQNTLAPLAASASHDEGAKTDIPPQRAEKLSLSSKRAKLLHDSLQNDAANTGALLRTRSDLLSTNSQVVLLQNEIALNSAERDKAKQTVLALQDKTRSQQSTLAAEKKKADSLIAARQQEISLLSMKSEKMRTDSVALAHQQDQQLQTLNPAPAALIAPYTALQKEIGVLQAQTDSLKRSSAGSQGRIGDDTRKVSLQLASINRSIDLASSSLASLNATKLSAASRLARDKERDDSLAGAAEREITAVTAQLDKARRDSTAAEAIVRQSSQRVLSGLAAEDSALAARQHDYSQLSADYSRALDDSAKTAEKIPANLQSFHQAIRSVDATIALKEKELADLQLKRDKAKQDSLQEYKRQSETLVAAHNEIVKRLTVLAQKKTEITAAGLKKKKALQDTAVYQREGRAAVASATMEIQRLIALIEKRKSELARVRNESAAASVNLKGPAERSGGSIESSPPPVSPAAAMPANGGFAGVSDIAQKRSEEIYLLLGDNRVGEAAKRFKTMQGFLKGNLDPDAFQTLRTTIEQMGGSLK